MTEKKMTVLLGGQERTLDFGKFRFQEYLGQALGTDPMNMSEIILKPEMQFKYVTSLIYAGMRTDYKYRRAKEDFKRYDVDDWVGDLEGEQVADIIKSFRELTQGAEGEANPQAEADRPGTT